MRVALLSPLWPAARERLAGRHEVVPALGPGVLAAVVRSGVRLDRAAFGSAPDLRLVVRAGAGTDAIDLDAAAAGGIRVVVVPASSRSVAEHALGLLLCLERRIPALDRALREGRWEKGSGVGREIRGRTLGLLGFGRIGRSLAELARALGMEVQAFDRSPGKPEKREAAGRLGVSFREIGDLVSSSDAVSVQLPLDASTRGLVGEALLARMRPGAVLVNVGRGGVVDERALHDALRDGRLRGAALDVFAEEPPGDHPLLRLPNFVGTPHVGAATAEAQSAIGEEVVRILDAFAEEAP